MPFVTITDPVEAHRYRQAGMLWYYSRMTERWVALNSEAGRNIPLEQHIESMRAPMIPAKYAILVESEE